MIADGLNHWMKFGPEGAVTGSDPGSFTLNLNWILVTFYNSAPISHNLTVRYPISVIFSRIFHRENLGRYSYRQDTRLAGFLSEKLVRESGTNYKYWKLESNNCDNLNRPK